MSYQQPWQSEEAEDEGPEGEEEEDEGMAEDVHTELQTNNYNLLSLGDLFLSSMMTQRVSTCMTETKTELKLSH